MIFISSSNILSKIHSLAPFSIQKITKRIVHNRNTELTVFTIVSKSDLSDELFTKFLANLKKSNVPDQGNGTDLSILDDNTVELSVPTEKLADW